MTNSGPSDATYLSVIDDLPVGATYVSADGTGWVCGSIPGQVACTRDTLAAGATGSIVITALAPLPAGVVTNTASISSVATDLDSLNNTSTVTTTVIAVVDLSIGKTDGSASVAPGQAITYTIVATNAGPSPADGVTVTDTLPAAITSATWTCAAMAGSACDSASGTGNISTTLGLAAGGVVTFTVPVTISPSASGTLANTATVAPPGNATETNPADNAATDTDTLVASADLAIAKTHASDFVVGSDGTYTLTVTNNGPSNAAGPVLVTDTLPAGLSYVSGTGTGWTCGAVGQQVSCSHASALAPAESTQIVVVATAALAAYPSVVNAVAVSSTTADPNGTNNTATDSTTVTLVSDLAIGKTDGAASVAAGVQVTYTVTVTNNGPSPVTGAVVSDTLPAALSGVTWTCAAASGSACGAASGSGNISTTVDLLLNGTATFVVVGTLPSSATGTLSNTATVAVPVGVTDPASGNNTATDTDAITSEADLAVAKAHVGNFVIGLNGTYVITVTNNGPSQASGSILVTDTLPTGMTPVSSSGTGWFCSVAGQLVTCSNASNLASGAGTAVTLTVAIDGSVSPSATNIVTTTSASADPNLGDNSATDVVAALAPADLQMSKTVAGTLAPGGTVTYTLTYTNTGGHPATGVVVTETVPANTQYMGTGWTCALGTGPGSICTQSGTPVASGAGGSLSFVVTITNPVPAGGYQLVNTATVGDDGTHGSDPTPANNTATDTTAISGAAPDVRIVKTHSVVTTTPGSVITFTLSYSNSGNIGASGVTLTETVPANASYSGSGWSCSPDANAGSICVYNAGTLAGEGGSGSTPFVLTIASTVPSGTSAITNTVTIGDDGANGVDAATGNNTATDSVTLTTHPDLVITKTEGGVSVAPGGAITYTLNYTNVGNTGAANAYLFETVPNYTTFSGSGWTCLPDTSAGSTCTAFLGTVVAGSGGMAQFPGDGCQTAALDDHDDFEHGVDQRRWAEWHGCQPGGQCGHGHDAGDPGARPRDRQE